MNFVIDDIEQVVEYMRPINVSYGQPMLDYLLRFPKAEKDDMPFFEYGHPIELVNNLAVKRKDPVGKFNKYPMIYLQTDIDERTIKALWEYKLTIYIVAYTDLNYTSKQRKENVFGPVLYPIYERLMKELARTGIFSLGDNFITPLHTKIDRFFWGNQLNKNNTANILEDPLDAIEIKDLKLIQFDRNKC